MSRVNHGIPTSKRLSSRTPEDDIIYSGAPRNAYVPPVYCEIRPTIDAADAAPFSLCGTDVLLELCEISTGIVNNFKSYSSQLTIFCHDELIA